MPAPHAGVQEGKPIRPVLADDRETHASRPSESPFKRGYGRPVGAYSVQSTTMTGARFVFWFGDCNYVLLGEGSLSLFGGCHYNSGANAWTRRHPGLSCACIPCIDIGYQARFAFWNAPPCRSSFIYGMCYTATGTYTPSHHLSKFCLCQGAYRIVT